MAVAERERRLLILYGSQTGYAEDTARRIARQAWRRHFSTQVQAMDQADRALVFATTCPVIFVCSTTGQGEEPDNMKRFWHFLLRKSIPHDALEGMEFAVFGLGDSSYQKFNFPAKRLFRRLQQLGASPIVPRGDGDDQHYLGTDGTLDPWLVNLWSALLDRLPLPEPIISDLVTPEPTFDVDFATSDAGKLAIQQGLPTTTIENSYPAKLTVSERITAEDHFQDVRHFQFELQDHAGVPTWGPGDCAVFRPSNLEKDVCAFLKTMGWLGDADRPISVAPRDPASAPPWLPRHTTLRWLFTSYFDIMSVPRRSFFEMLYYFSRGEDEKEKLREFSSAAGQDELHTYCMRPKRTILEVLDDFPESRVPLAYIFDVFPVIAERSFSISSSCAVTPRTIDLTVAIVKYKTIMYRPRVGVCTQWLAHLPVGQTVPLRFSKGTMKLPADTSTPIIMVGPGTGIAAFMSFIQKRRHDGASDNYLFFGCRSKSKDFYYRDELESWQSDRSLHLYCAFSRDQEGKKDYVQHRILENSKPIWSLIDEHGAVVYVSGNANRMPEDVRQAFVGVVSGNSSMDSDEASGYIKAMEKAGRYQEECWY
ncbi:riboflavin synthase domain-like protein [Martensiomyces pterosporus]|nr:riboflavin synthase domain-like protein [Martensiomyces pterosporus]